MLPVFSLVLGAGLMALPATTQATAPDVPPKPPCSCADAQAPLRVLAAHPVVHGLAGRLLAGSTLELVRVAPAQLPANRQPAYLAGRGLDKLLAAAGQAQAVLSLRSIWPQDQLYPLARRANIRLVEIDVAQPIEGDLPGITSVETGAGVLERQPWQDATNLARMATLMADALQRLDPSQAPQLQTNLGRIKQDLQTAQTQASLALAPLDALPVLLLSPRTQTFAQALQLEPVPWQPPAQDADLPAALGQALAHTRATVVLTHAAPDEAVARSIQAAGATLVVLPESAADPVAALAQAMLATADALAAAR